MKKILRFNSHQENYGVYLEEIEELLLDLKDDGIRCGVFPSAYSKPTFQICVNLDINLHNHIKISYDKTESFNEYADKMISVLNSFKGIFKRLQDIDFNILSCELTNGKYNDYFTIDIEKILE